MLIQSIGVLLILSGVALFIYIVRTVERYEAHQRELKRAELAETLDRHARHVRENQLLVTRFLNSKNGTEETAQADDETQAPKQEDR